jgi:hypothetical protein
MYQDKQLVGIRIAELTREAEVARLASPLSSHPQRTPRFNLFRIIGHRRRLQAGI